jgi:hypothetical protein
MVASGPGPTHNDGPALVAAATAVNARNSVLRIVYGDHAIILIATASHVESIEAVAGDAAHVRPLGDCLVNRADLINITHAQAVAAIGSLLSANLGIRTAAWARISRSAIDVFEGGRGVRNLAITIRPLTTTAAAAQAMRTRIDAMKTWAHFGLAGHYGRLACWECLKVHGPTAGGFFGQWHTCTACYRMYCDWCGDKLTWWSYVTRTRRCGCGQETELNAGP